MKFIFYIKRELKNAFEFYLIPFLYVLLPHKLVYPFCKFICNSTRLYSKYSHESESRYLQMFPDDKRCHWERNVKLLHLMDITDFWCSWLRPKRTKKQLQHTGEWCTQQGFLALSMHWGTGFPALVDLKSHGLFPHFVFQNSQAKIKYQSILERKYRQMRRRFYKKVSEDIALSTGGSFQRILDLTAKGEVPVILFDAPQAGKTTTHSINVFERKYSLASGFIRLICDEKTPFQLFRLQMNFDSGQRTLEIEPLQSVTSYSQLQTLLQEFFIKNIMDSPESWYFWRQSSELFESLDNE